jgi:predicted acylesterase/phospholipase RssA/CRP-like cAMP-binding protein
VAGPTSKLATRIGHRWVLAGGAFVWSAGLVWFITRVDFEPDFLGTWLPGMVILGIGAGATFPNLSGAAVASAPGESFGTATGLNSVARQVGAALGVAIVVAIIGMPSVYGAAAAFDHAWTFCAAALAGAGVGCLLIGRLGPREEAVLPTLRPSTHKVLTVPQRVEQPRVYAPMLRPEEGEAMTLTSPAESTGDFLARVPLFAELPDRLRVALAERSSMVHLEAGETLFRAGQPGDAMYVVRAGRVAVVAPEGHVIREIGRGGSIGELALLTSAPRAASIRAARSSDLIRIGQADFEPLLRQAPELSLALNHTLADRLRDTRGMQDGARPQATTVALVPLDDRVPMQGIAFALTQTLAAHQRTTQLQRSDAPTPPVGSDPIAAYAPLLDRAEAGNEKIVLVAGRPDGADPWTDFCLQQADRIVAIAAGVAPRGGVGPTGVRAELRGCDLVGWDVPVGSGALAAWAEQIDPIETHAIHERDMRAGIDRLTRRLAGRSVGIVLSGGGARGFAHIGVLEELREAGIVIDRVAGVSMGAFVGGMVALGMSPEEIDARCYDEWVRRSPLKDYTIPRHGLIRGARAEAMLRRTFGDSRIEELDRAFMCGAADLRTGEQVMARHGSLWEAVGVSMAIPILVPPVVHDGRMLVDGSLVDNLPVGPMADLAEGPIIAVDIKTSFDGGGPRPATRQGAPRVPALGETLTRVLFMGSSNTSDAARRHADLIVKPHGAGIGLFEWHQIDRAREEGRIAAREALKKAPSSIFG